MSAIRSARTVATVLGVGALGLGLLTACSDSSDDASPATSESQVSTTSEEAQDPPAMQECSREAPTGPLAVPTTSTEYTSGEAAYSVTLSDGTERCVVVESDSSGGDFDSTDKEIDIRFGDTSAGLLITIDGEKEGNLPTEVPQKVGDAFMGMQVDGNYFADSMHSGCEVTLTGLDDEMIAGEFTCTDVTLFEDGPFSLGSESTTTPLPEDTTITDAKGWFVLRA